METATGASAAASSSPDNPASSTGPEDSTPKTTAKKSESKKPKDNDSSKTPAALTEPSKAFSMEEANEEIAMLLESGKVSLKEVTALQGMMREHAALREKVGKLKSLLGRSAKAQREAKIDLEATQKRLEQALREIERLNQKVDRLANRPTHMELLADFESNFDRALLTVGQAGGQDTAAPIAGGGSNSAVEQEAAIVESMLMQELAESKSRIEKLESLNAALLHRSSQLEAESKDLKTERDTARKDVTHLQLELRMAQMEAEHATRAMQDKVASLEEMQMEIDMVTKASVNANVRAAQGEAAARSVKTDLQHVQQLESQVQALQEWAVASSESKRLAMERIQLLEQQLRHFQGRGDGADQQTGHERRLFTKGGSLVIGAGDTGNVVVELGEHAKSLQPNERVMLRWKFDLTPNDQNIDFNIMKGNCPTSAQQSRAEYMIKDRVVTGGAAGETEFAFSVDNSCTLLWSNAKSWVRPRTIKYTLEAGAVQM